MREVCRDPDKSILDNTESFGNIYRANPVFQFLQMTYRLDNRTTKNTVYTYWRLLQKSDLIMK
jgi:hypothetical protein